MDPLEFEENVYYEQAEKPDIFLVTIVENETAAKCNLAGDYEFHVNTMNFALVNPSIKKPLFIWPFRYVRRYGGADNNFQFEAGRKCQSGEGLFSIITKGTDGKKIFSLVQTRFKSIKKRDKDFMATSGNDQSSSKAESVKKSSNPSLPPREYENGKPKSPLQKTSSTTRPAKPPKPGSVKSYQNVTKEQAKGKDEAPNLDDLISKHRQKLIPQATDAENTYGDIAGAKLQPPDSYAYSTANTQNVYNDEENTYDEVRN